LTFSITAGLPDAMAFIPHISRAYSFESKESQNDFSKEAMIANQMYRGHERARGALLPGQEEEKVFFVRLLVV
jgi:hypothetical protein